MVSLRLSAVTVLTVCIFILFSACAINSTTSKLSSEEKARMSRMLVFESEGLPEGSYEIISAVESISCKKSYTEIFFCQDKMICTLPPNGTP